MEMEKKYFEANAPVPFVLIVGPAKGHLVFWSNGRWGHQAGTPMVLADFYMLGGHLGLAGSFFLVLQISFWSTSNYNTKYSFKNTIVDK